MFISSPGNRVNLVRNTIMLNVIFYIILPNQKYIKSSVKVV